MKTLTYNGNTYHINQVPVKETKTGHKIKKDDYILANEKTFIFFKKNVHDFEIVSELRHWFEDLKQPSESRVRDAMILIIDEDYTLKSGGGSASDHIYSSSLKWMQASPITGEDIEPVILKKFSRKFEDVLITLDEIEYLILNSLTEKEKIQKIKNDIESNIGFLVDAIKRGKYRQRLDNKVKEVPYTPELKSKVFENIIELNNIEHAIKFIDERIDMLEKLNEPFITGINWIVSKNDWKSKDEEATQREIDFHNKIINIYKSIKEELVPVLVIYLNNIMKISLN